MRWGHPDRWLAALLERELPAAGERRVVAHLRRCVRCRGRLALVESGLAATRDLRPQEPPLELDRRLRQLLAAAASPAEPPRAAATPWLLPLPRWSRIGLPALAAVALLLWVGSTRGAELELAAAPPGPFERLAVASHRDFDRLAEDERGAPAPAVRGDAATLRAWLTERGLSAALADRRPAAEAASFTLRGAVDVSRPGLRAAAVGYRVDGEPLTLLVARQEEVSEAPAWGLFGKRVRYRAAEGVQVLTWTNSGKAYALIASATGASTVQRGCLLCHTEGRRAEQARRLVLPPLPRG